MMVDFKVPRAIDGVSYSKGVHEVPDEKKGHWYMLALIGNGQAAIVSDGAKMSAKKPVSRDESKAPLTAPVAQVFQPEVAPLQSTQLEEKFTEAPKESKADKAKRLKDEKHNKIIKAASGK